MRYHVLLCLLLVCFWAVLVPFSALARQNTLIGEISVGYDFQERNYKEDEGENEEEDGSGAGAVEGEESQAPTVIVLEDRRGDRKRYFISPRIRLASQGVSDLIEFTYAPTFNYDEVYSESEVDHDLNLLAEKNFTRNWLVRVSDSFFYGDDPYRDSELRTAVIIPGQEIPVEDPVVGAGQEGQEGEDLTESFGRRRFWRNTLTLDTDYTYRDDSIFGVTYNFGMLRNLTETDISAGGYTEYDRHEGIARLTYRFNRQWDSEVEARYIKGDFADPEVFVVSPGEGEEEPVVDPVGETISDDLEEYYARLRVDYDWSAHDVFFGEYRYGLTDYEVDLRADSKVHEISFGWDHDFTPQIRLTLSGGPTIVEEDNLPSTSSEGDATVITPAESDSTSTVTDYNFFGALSWAFLHSQLNLTAEKGYDYENFNGRRDGLTDFWVARIDYTYQFSPAINCVLGGGYRWASRSQPPAIGTVVIIDDGETEGGDIPSDIVEEANFEYTEDTYDAGLTLNYSFLRWYTLSASYRYYDRRSGAEADYDEHRVFIALSASKELLRW